jgi:hypothetical protein
MPAELSLAADPPTLKVRRILVRRQAGRQRTVGALVDRRRRFLAQRIVRPLPVVDQPEPIECTLLKLRCRTRRPRRFCLQRTVEAFVRAVLLRPAWTNPFEPDAEPQPPDRQVRQRSYQKLVEFVGRLHAAGVPIVAGTDWTAGSTLQRELELYVQAGLTPAKALRTATWNGALFAGVLGDRGSIEAGKRADLVLFDGDPTKNIADLRRAVLVIRGDVAYRPAEVYEALGIKPFAPALPVATMP